MILTGLELALGLFLGWAAISIVLGLIHFALEVAACFKKD